MELGDEDHNYLLLVDRRGQVLWQGRGPYLPESAASLLQALDNLLYAPIKMVEI